MLSIYPSVMEDPEKSRSVKNDESVFFQNGCHQSFCSTCNTSLLLLKILVSHLMFWGSDFPMCIVGFIVFFSPNTFIFFKDALKCLKKSWVSLKQLSCKKKKKKGCLGRYHEVLSVPTSLFPPPTFLLTWLLASYVV